MKTFFFALPSYFTDNRCFINSKNITTFIALKIFEKWHNVPTVLFFIFVLSIYIYFCKFQLIENKIVTVLYVFIEGHVNIKRVKCSHTVLIDAQHSITFEKRYWKNALHIDYGASWAFLPLFQPQFVYNLETTHPIQFLDSSN